MPISTEELHERADQAASNADFVSALRFAGEILRVCPEDHRARLKVGLCLAALGELSSAVDVLLAAAEQVFERGFVLSSVAMCRAALSFGTDQDRVRDLLRRIHPTIAGAVGTSRSVVVPPVPPFTLVDGGEESLLEMPEEMLLASVRRWTATPAGTASTSNVPESQESPEVGPLASAGESLVGEAPGAEVDARGSTSPNSSARPAGTIHVSLFSDLSTEAFVYLVERLGYLNLPSGACVIEEGSTGSSLFVLLQGEVEIVMNKAGAPQRLARLGPGALFGELSLLTDKPRSATVWTTQPSELFEVDRSSIESVAKQYPSIVDELVAFARRRLLMNVIATSPVFAALGEIERHEVLKAFVSKVYEEGQTVIQEAQVPEGLYVVLEGVFEVSKNDATGDAVVLAYLHAGDVFGEMGLLEDRPTTATVRASEKSMVLYLDRDRFKASMAEHPSMASYLEALSSTRAQAAEGAVLAEDVVLDADDLVLL